LFIGLFIGLFIDLFWLTTIYNCDTFLYLSAGHSGSLSLDRLGKVGAHEALEVEVGELILLLELEKRRKLGIRVNLATIGAVLELVGADVSVDVAGHSGARHLGTLLLTKEGSELVTDAGGLDKARGLAVARLALALGAELLGSLELTLPLLLHSLVLRLNGRNHGSKKLELGIKLGGLLKEGGLNRITLGSRGGVNRGNGSSLNLGGLGSLRGLGSLYCRSSRGNILNNGGRGSDLGRGLSGLRLRGHTILYLDD
jgi:hypothetical protein